MKLKPILWTLFVVALVTFPWLALRGRAAMQVLSAESLAVKEVDLPPASPATDIALPDSDDAAVVQPVADAAPPNGGLPEIAKPEPTKPSIDPSNAKSNDNAPVAADRPIGPIKKANIRVVPFQIQSQRAEVRFTEAYRLKNQDAARIAEELKKIVPELEITHDAATESVVIQEMTPKQREFVTEVIQRLVAARAKSTTATETPASSSGARGPLPPPSAGPIGTLQPIGALQRGLNAMGTPNQDRATLKADVRRAFEARQESARKELAEFRSRIERLSQTLEDRERSKDTIIERRVDELLNPNLRWDTAGNPTGESGSYFPATGSTVRPATSTPFDGPNVVPTTSGSYPPGSHSGRNGVRPPRPAAGVEVGVPNPQLFKRPKELEFLGQYPRFSNLSLDMTETQFRAFLEQQKLAPQLSIPKADQLNYSIPLGDGLRLTVMFGLDGKCRGIERLSGDQAAESPLPPNDTKPADPAAATPTGTSVVTPKDLEFLSQYPRFSGLSFDMQEKEFQRFEKEQLTAQMSLPGNGELGYSIPLDDGCHLTVVFARNGKCQRIERIGGRASGDQSSLAPSPSPPGRSKPVTKIFRLQHTTTENVAETLRSLAGENSFAAKYAIEAKNNSLIVIATNDDLLVIEAVIKRLDMAPESFRPNAEPKPSDGPRTASPEDGSASVLPKRRHQFSASASENGT